MRVRLPVLGGMLVANMALLTVAGPSFGILASTLIESFDISRGQIGQLNAGYAVIGAIVSPFTGRLADRIGGRNTMTLGFLAAALVFVVLGTANGFLMLLIAGVLSGVPNGMGNQGTNKYISAEVPPERRGVITGVKQSGVMFGVFMAGVWLPRGVTTIGYRPTMFVVVALAMTAAVVIRLVLPADETTSTVGERAEARLPSSIRWLAGYAALMGGAVGCQSAFLALYAEEELGLSRSQSGLLVGITGLMGIAARVLYGRFTQTRTTFSPILMFIALGAVGSFVLIRLATEFGTWMIFATPVVAGFTTNSWNTPVMLASMRLVPAGAAGRSAGLVMLGFMTGYAIVPPLFGTAVDRLGSYDLPWLAGIFFCLAAAAVAALWRRTELSSSEQEIVQVSG